MEITAKYIENSGLTASLTGERTFGARSAVRLTEITLLASEWVGEQNKYSQVVSVEGVTPYSLVDLQPSVEQLEIFHEKDIAFTTENNDGVVTVVVVGDKPTNDYTMQATLTEVTV